MVQIQRSFDKHKLTLKTVFFTEENGHVFNKETGQQFWQSWKNGRISALNLLLAKNSDSLNGNLKGT
jgi:hypothetical protein